MSLLFPRGNDESCHQGWFFARPSEFVIGNIRVSGESIPINLRRWLNIMDYSKGEWFICPSHQAGVPSYSCISNRFLSFLDPWCEIGSRWDLRWIASTSLVPKLEGFVDRRCAWLGSEWSKYSTWETLALTSLRRLYSDCARSHVVTLRIVNIKARPNRISETVVAALMIVEAVLWLSSGCPLESSGVPELLILPWPSVGLDIG